MQLFYGIAHCEFGAGLADTLRDRLVCGMKNEKVQRRLLTMKNLTYALALEEAEMAERVARDAAQFHESGTTVEVHQVPKKTEFKKTKRCYRCEGNTILKRVGLSRKNADIVTKLGISNELVERNRETTDSGSCLTR